MKPFEKGTMISQKTLWTPYLTALAIIFTIFPLFEFSCSDDDKINGSAILMSDAQVFFKQSDFPKCLANLNKIIMKYPNSKEVEKAYFMIGDCYFTDIEFYKDLKAAQEAYQTALDLYPKSHYSEETYLKLAGAFEKDDNILDASLVYSDFLKEFPESDQFQRITFTFAEYEYIMGNPRNAVKMFSSYIKNYPQAPEIEKVFYRIGDCFFTQFDYKIALEYYNIALGKYPDYINDKPNLMFRIAETNYQMDQFEAAEKFFVTYNNYFSDKESVPDAIMRTGDCFFFNGNNKKALFFYEEVINRFPESSTSYLSQIKKFGLEVKLNPLKKHNFKKLMTLIENIDPSDPQIATINYRIAEILLLNEYPEESYKVAIKALQLGNDKEIESKCFEIRLKAMEKVFQIYSKQRNYGEILNFFVRDRNQFMAYDYYPEIYYLLSDALFRLGSYNDAKQYLLMIPDQEMTKEKYLWLELRIYDSLGMRSKTIYVGEKFLKIYPTSFAKVQTLHILAHAYYKEKQYKKSISVFKKAFKSSLDNVDPFSYFYIGMAYYKIDDYKNALTWLVKAEEAISGFEEKEQKESEQIDKNIKEAIDEIALAIPNTYYNLGKYKNGLGLYLDYLKKYPDSDNVPFGLYQVGKIYLKLDDMKNAKMYFDDLMSKYKGTFWSDQASILLKNQKIESTFDDVKK